MWEGEPASRPAPRMDEPSPVWPEVTVFSVGVELSPAASGTWSVEQLGCCLCLPGSGREEKQGCRPGAGEDWPSDTGTENRGWRTEGPGTLPFRSLSVRVSPASVARCP